MNGKKEHTMKSILNLIEKGCGKEPNSTKLIKTTPSETISHDGNMIKLAEFFE